MKILKLAVLAACSLALTAPLVPAQSQMLVPYGAQMPALRAGLGLTPAQKAKLTALAQNTSQQMQAVNADRSLTPLARTAKVRAVAQNITARMMALLTPAQRTKAKAMMQRAQAKGWQGGGATRYRFEDAGSLETQHP